MIPQYMKSCTYYISLILIVCLGMVSCTEQNIGEMDQNQYIELTVSCVNLNATRADGSTLPGENAYNENRIETLHYFLYKDGETDQNAVMQGFIDAINDNDGSYTLQIPMREDELNNSVFPMPYEECEVYLIANLPTNTNIPQETKLESLKEMIISTVFQKANPESGKEFTEQSSFVMDGLGKARIVKRSETIAATGDIQLGRLAAKFTVRISVDDTFTDTNGKKYTPVVDKMQVHLVNASNTTQLTGALGTRNFDYYARNKFVTQNVTKKVIDENTKQEKEVNRVMYVFEPFYSYPLSWEYKDENALVLHVMLPWKEEGKDNWERCNYKVFPSTLQLDRNNWYNIDLHIGVLGSFDNVEENWPEITGEYKVLNWNNGTTDWGIGLEIDTDILGARYLVVEQNEYVVNNKNTFEIPFISSHACEIEWSVQRYNFYEKNNNNYIPQLLTLSQNSTNSNWLTLDATTNTIKLNHELINFNDNSSNTDYDYATYIYTVTLRHKDKDKFSEVITIYQRPALIIEPYVNSGFVDDMEDNYGYYFVNGCYENFNNTDNINKKAYNYGGASGPQSYHTKNPSMYVVETTVLPADSKYILGDPRDFNFSFTDDDMKEFVNAYPIGNYFQGNTSQEKRTLSKTSYRPTLSDASVENMISPKFRIASSYGVCTSNMSYEEARKRCATYQEDGYPAGRWRIPTKAEVLFMIKLSKDEKITKLFNTTYWCANGTVSEDGTFTATTSSKYYVRPVYDEWYWEKSDYPRLTGTYKEFFVWGDEVE